MTSRAKSLPWLVALLVAAAIVCWPPAGFRRGGDAQQPATAGSADAAALRGQATSPPPESPTRPAQAALPPVDAPLSAIVEPLVARADGGDSKAACRLAMELLRCEALAFYETIPAFNGPSQEARLEAKGQLDAADRVAAAEIARIRLMQECRTIPSGLRGRGGHYLGQAARAGEPEAMVRYADSQLWPPDGRGIYSDPEYDRWRRDAPAMLHRAFAAGVPEAVIVLMTAYQGDYGGVGSIIPNDPVKGEALRMLTVRMHGVPDRRTPGTLDATSLARASALAKQWHEGPFKGRSYRGQGRVMFQPAAFPTHDGAPQDFCRSERL